MYTIATLYDIRQHLNLADDDTSADADLLKALQQASHILSQFSIIFCCYSIKNVQSCNKTTVSLAELD